MARARVVQLMAHAITIDPGAAERQLGTVEIVGDDVLAARCFLAVVLGDFERAIVALEGPHRPSDSVLLAAVRDYVHAVCLARVPADLGAHRVDLGTPEGALVGFLLCEAAMTSGQIALTERLATDVLALSGPDDPMRTWTRLVRSRALSFLGRLDEARVECQRVLAEATGLPVTRRVAQGVAAFIDAHSGSGRGTDLGRWCERLREEVAEPSTYADSVVFLLAALAQSAAGNPTAAADVLRFGAGGPGMPLLPLVIRAYGYDVLVEAAVANAQIPDAHALLTAYDTLPVSDHPMASAARERARARLALVRTQHAASVTAATSSAELAAGVGGELYVVRANVLRALAEAASGEGAPGRHRLDDLARTAARSGSQEIHAWSVRELEAVGRRVRGFPGIGWDTLSTQQQVIARLAAQGLRNREIGEAMHLAEKTVESHVATILAALGATNRVGIGRELGGRAVDPVFGRELTARQREVAVLVAEGRSNADISRLLVISEKTVEKHVASLFVRLGVRTRAAIAACVRGATGPTPRP